MVAPGVIRAVAVGAERPAEVRHGEDSDAILHAYFTHRGPEIVQVTAHVLQQPALRRQLAVVRVEAEDLDEEDLPSVAELLVGLDDPRHFVQLLVQIAVAALAAVAGVVRELRGEVAGGGERVRDHRDLRVRIGDDRLVLAHHDVRIGGRLAEQILHDLHPRAVQVVRVAEHVEGRSARGTEHVRQRRLAVLPGVGAADVHVVGEVGSHTLAGEQIGDEASPPEEVLRLRVARHPLIGLVDVLRHGGRLDERPDVADQGELARLEQRLQLGAAGVHAVGVAVARHPVEREERVLPDREVPAAGGVGRVRTARGRDDHVEAVVAAGEVDADERLVPAHVGAVRARPTCPGQRRRVAGCHAWRGSSS